MDDSDIRRGSPPPEPVVAPEEFSDDGVAPVDASSRVASRRGGGVGALRPGVRRDDLTTEGSIPRGTLPEERLVEMRRRIEAGYHDRPEVAEEVARRLRASGDLDDRG
jgi:hypothetical protein